MMTRSEEDRHPVGDAAEDAAVVVGGGLLHLTILDAERVVCLAARLGGKAKARAPNSIPLTAGMPNTSEAMRLSMRSNIRVADAGRQSDGGAFDDTHPPNPVGRGCLQ